MLSFNIFSQPRLLSFHPGILKAVSIQYSHHLSPFPHIPLGVTGQLKRTLSHARHTLALQREVCVGVEVNQNTAYSQ